jgi:hypothetical protein
MFWFAIVLFPPKYRTQFFVVFAGYGREFPVRFSVRITPAHENWPTFAGRFALRGDIRRGKFLLSRPMTGHTLRKLPCLHAISRFIAVRTQASPAARSHIILHTRQNVKNFFGVFDKILKKNL